VLKLIKSDQSLSSQVLRMSNSSYYAGLSKISTIKEAIVRLGIQEIANLAMMASQFEFYHSSNETIDSYMQCLWKHAFSCATGAKWLARKAGYPDLAQEAFMGGLLHDIGKLALLKILDDIVRSKESKANFSDTLIRDVLDNMHEDVGYRLMTSWNLPEPYCKISVNHHSEEFDGNDTLLVLVRLSNLACRKVGKVIQPDPSIMLFSTPEAHFLGLKEISLAELEVLIEDACEIEA